jgi:hypothetical protein
MGKAIPVPKYRFKYDSQTLPCKRVSTCYVKANGAELKSVTARRRSWRAKEYNSLTQGRPLSPSTQRYYEEQFGQGNLDYPAAQLYANGGNWQQEAFNGYPIDASYDSHPGQL